MLGCVALAVSRSLDFTELYYTVYTVDILIIQGEKTPVYVAASNGNVDMLNMLIDAGGDVNIADLVSLCTVHVTGYYNENC